MIKELESTLFVDRASMDIETILKTLQIRIEEKKDDANQEVIFDTKSTEQIVTVTKDHHIIAWWFNKHDNYLYTMIAKEKHGKKSGIYKR